MSRADVSLISPYPALSGSHHAGTSGVASYGANLARALRDRGATVHVVAPADEHGPGTEHDGDQITVERCFRPGARGLRTAVQAVARAGAPVAHLQFELFLYGGPGAIGGAVGALGALRRRRTPTVVTLHQAVAPAVVDRGYRELHRIPVPTPVARAGIRSVQGALAGAASATVVHEAPFREVVPRATVIPHGIEPVAAADSRDDARVALGLDDRFVALCFGFLAPYKGLELALDAAELAGDDVLVVVAGGPHPRLAAAGDRYATDLEARYGHRARFTGWVQGEDVTRWFRAADVAVFPYPKPFSSSGAVALALACGTPMLLSTPMARCIGAPSELAVASADELAHRLRRLARDAGARAALRSWTDCLARGRSWPDVADRHLALYGALAA